jgi:chromosome segregation ATPase
MVGGGTISLHGGWQMPKGSRDVIIAAVAAILAALIGAGATLYTTDKQINAERQRRESVQRKLEIYQARYENAPKAFIEQLGRLVDTAPKYENARGTDTRLLNPDPEYRQTVSVSAQSIVAARNDLRSSLDAIGSRLDSQIDELQTELAKPNPDPERLITILEVLRQKWPAKQAEIELAVRKLQAELGFVPVEGQ